MSINIYFVEDDPGFCKHLLQLIASTPTLECAGHAQTLAEAFEALPLPQVDLYMIDIGLPDGSGIDLMRHLHEQQPQARILAFTTLGDDKHILQSLEAGAHGYLIKTEGPQEILKSIMTLVNAGGYLSGQASKVLIEQWRHPAITPSPLRALPFPSLHANPARRLHDEPRAHARAPLPHITPAAEPFGAPDPGLRSNPTKSDSILTPKEQMVLAGVQQGLQAKGIANDMGISIFTVNQHLRSIYRKLKVRNKMEAILVARQQGVI